MNNSRNALHVRLVPALVLVVTVGVAGATTDEYTHHTMIILGLYDDGRTRDVSVKLRIIARTSQTDDDDNK